MPVINYTAGLQAWARGEVEWLATGGSDIRAVLVNDTYTPDAEAHTALDDIPSGARIATSGSISLQDAVGGLCKANNTTVSSVSGGTIAAVVVYLHTGTESTSTLLCCITERSNEDPLEFPTNGGDVNIIWGGGTGVVTEFKSPEAA